MSSATQCYQTGVLTVSDSCFYKGVEDRSGKAIIELLLKNDKLHIKGTVHTKIVPDDRDMIERTLKSWADELQCDLILTTGGTGFSPRDVTPEATLAVSERQAPGFAQSIIALCSKDKSFALLSRATCGIRGTTIIYNLPGSVKGATECFLEAAKILPHAIDQLKDNKQAVEQFHKGIQDPSSVTGRKSKVIISNVASRCRTSKYPMMSTLEALKIVLDNAAIGCIETKPFNESAGFVCAHDVKAITPLPPFRASVKDGYAVFAAEGKGIRTVLNVLTAGDDPCSYSLEPGGCVRVSTGAPVPLNADAVVQVEDTLVTERSYEGNEEHAINISTVPKPGQDIREVGSDIAAGQTIIRKGKTVNSYDYGVMAATGITKIAIHSAPKVAVLSTGDELVKTAKDLKAGYIVDSNKPVLSNILKEMKVHFYDAGIAKDCPDDLRDKLEEAFIKSDIIIVTGGVSMGEKDLVKEVLEVDFSATIHFGRIFMKPGKPTSFVTLTFERVKKYVFCLPGNPVSAAVTFNLFVVPFLRKAMGYEDVRQLTITTKLGQAIELDPRPEYHRVRLIWKDQDFKPTALSTGSQCSSRLLSFEDATGLMVLPHSTPERTRFDTGADVPVLLLNYFAHTDEII